MKDFRKAFDRLVEKLGEPGLKMWGDAGPGLGKDLSDLRESGEALSEVFNNAAIGICVLDATGRPMMLNARWAALSGLTEREAGGLGIEETVHAADSGEAMRALGGFQAGGPAYRSLRLRLQRKESGAIWADLTLVPSFDEHGVLKRVLCMAVDVSEQRAAEESLVLLKKAVESIDLGLTITDPEGRIIYTNPAEARMHGYRPDELLNKHVSIFAHRAERRGMGASAAGLAGVDNWKREAINVKKNGNIFPVQLTSVAVRKDNGGPTGIITISEDITERKRIDMALIHRVNIEKIIAGMFSLFMSLRPDEMDSGIVRAMKSIGEFSSVDRCYVALFNAEGSAIGNVYEWCDEKVSDRVRPLAAFPVSDMGWMMSRVRGLEVTYAPSVAELPPKEEREYWQSQGVKSLIVVPVVSGGEAIGFMGLESIAHETVWMVEDIRLLKMACEMTVNALDRKNIEERLRSISITDDLTGLLNRRGFFSIANKQLKISKRTNTAIFVVFADLDGLKTINDTLGHKEGDLALLDIVDVLKGTFRESDIIARLGGDEFAVLVVQGPDAHSEGIIVERLEGSVEEFNASSRRRFKLSLSVGAVRFDPQRPCSLEELLSSADKLMYEKKKKRRAS